MTRPTFFPCTSPRRLAATAQTLGSGWLLLFLSVLPALDARAADTAADLKAYLAKPGSTSCD